MTIAIFDLDGTLVKSGGQITDDMIKVLDKLVDKRIDLAIATGGQYEKVKWQLRECTYLFKYIFCECGAVTYVDDKLVQERDVFEGTDQTILKMVFRVFIDQCDKYEIDCVGRRIDVRSGLIYLTPTGMDAGDAVREPFIKYEQESEWRSTVIGLLRDVDQTETLEFVKGGKTGISVYPKGVDKTQIFEQLPKGEELYFFGDNCGPDGNDRPLYEHPLTKGYEVRDYGHCCTLLIMLFDINKDE